MWRFCEGEEEGLSIRMMQRSIILILFYCIPLSHPNFQNFQGRPSPPFFQFSILLLCTVYRGLVTNRSLGFSTKKVEFPKSLVKRRGIFYHAM